MRYPDFLKDGDTIGFVAPSFGCNIEPYRSGFDHAQKVLAKKGHGILLGPNVYAGDGTGISTAPEKCGKEFTEFYCSDNCQALISCGGGELMCEILPYVDFEAVSAAKPKWFQGFSDNTNLVFTLATLCDTAAIYAPCAPAFGMKPWHPAIHDSYKLLRGIKLSFSGYTKYETEPFKDKEHPLEPYACTEMRKIVAFDPADGLLPAGTACLSGTDAAKEVAFSGRLIGGCLDILATLCGTKFDRAADFAERYQDDGIIWFLEACDLNVFGIRRALWQLKNAGWFRHVKGFLIGRPMAGQEDLMGLDHIRAVTEILADFNVPILLDVDLGHLPPMVPLIAGSVANVHYEPARDHFQISMQLR